jgi:hypothetical protein
MAANVPIHLNQGGTILTIGTGGALDVETTSAIADLALDASATYAEVEIQSIADTIDDILAALRTAGIIPAS